MAGVSPALMRDTRRPHGDGDGPAEEAPRRPGGRPAVAGDASRPADKAAVPADTPGHGLRGHPHRALCRELLRRRGPGGVPSASRRAPPWRHRAPPVRPLAQPLQRLRGRETTGFRSSGTGPTGRRLRRARRCSPAACCTRPCASPRGGGTPSCRSSTTRRDRPSSRPTRRAPAPASRRPSRLRGAPRNRRGPAPFRNRRSSSWRLREGSVDRATR